MRSTAVVINVFTEISANKAMHSRFDLAIESSRLVWWGNGISNRSHRHPVLHVVCRGV